MKKIYYSTLFALMPLLVCSQMLSAPSKLVIGIGAKTHGFFACLHTVLNNIIYCDKNNVVPVVYWDEDCLYYQPEGYNGSFNAWEYYFEPVSNALYKKGDPIRKDYRGPDGYKMANFIRDNCETQKILRKQINQIINKYIRVKAPIRAKVDAFYKKEMLGKKTIGIHIRGTDKIKETKPVAVEEFARVANEAAQNLTNYQFLIATDEQKILEKITPLLNGRVISYDVHRSEDGKPIHKSGKNRALLGEEVLIEMLLLSKCTKFIHGCSNIPITVLFFNPEIDNTLLNAR